MQGFLRMAARNKPAGIRCLVYGMGKGKVVIEGLSVSSVLGLGSYLLYAGQYPLYKAKRERLFSRFLAIADRERLVDPHSLVANRGDGKAHFSG